MRDVRQFPASMTSVVEAPRAVSSDAKPDAATVRRQARLDASGAARLDLQELVEARPASRESYLDRLCWCHSVPSI